MKHLFKVILATFVLLSFNKDLKAQYLFENYKNGVEKDTSTWKDGITQIHFVGTGDVLLAYKNDKASKGIAANTGLGVLFWRIWDSGKELQLDAKVIVASSIDTLSSFEENNLITNSRLYGQYILVPSGTGPATTINSIWYFDRPPIAGQDFKEKSLMNKLRNYTDGIEVTGSASNQIWATYKNDILGGTKLSRSTHVSVFALRVGPFHEFLPQELRRKSGYSIRLGINAIVRSLQGDIGRHTEESEKMRQKFLESKKTVFGGAELNLALRLKNIRAEASLPYIFARSRNDIAGLTGAQFITSISFVGGFPLLMKD